MIPMVDLKRELNVYRGELLQAVTEVIDSGEYILGSKGKELEKKIAAYTGTSFALGAANGTDALYLALRAIGVKEGDEVITTPFTFFATAEAIAMTGAVPVFADIDPNTYNISPCSLKEKITDRTKAVIVVHLYGQTADMEPILETAAAYGLKVIEDACQAIGSEYKGKRAGSMGDIGCFSFFPSKNLGAFGDAGMVVTNDPILYEKMKVIANHGSAQKYIHSHIGVNSRLDEIQAAVLLVKLAHLDRFLDKRRKIATRYTSELSGLIKTPPVIKDRTHTFHQYCIETERRDELAAFLESQGIASAIYYPVPLHLQEAFAPLSYQKGDFPVSERAACSVLALPISPGLGNEQQATIIQAVKSFFSSHSKE